MLEAEENALPRCLHQDVVLVRRYRFFDLFHSGPILSAGSGNSDFLARISATANS